MANSTTDSADVELESFERSRRASSPQSITRETTTQYSPFLATPESAAFSQATSFSSRTTLAAQDASSTQHLLGDELDDHTCQNSPSFDEGQVHPMRHDIASLRNQPTGEIKRARKVLGSMWHPMVAFGKNEDRFSKNKQAHRMCTSQQEMLISSE